MRFVASLSLIGLWLLCSWPPVIYAETSHNFANWEQEITGFEQMDRANAPAKGALLFTGSSTIRRWETLAKDFPGRQVLNRGFGGSEIVDCTHFADRMIFPYEPRLIFLRSGGNDLHAGKSSEQVFADFKEFVAKVTSKLPESDIVFISISPSLSRRKEAAQTKELNEMVKVYSKHTPHVKYLEAYDISLGSDGQPRADLFVSDQLHFNSEGYRLLAERVRGFLTKESL